MISSIPQRIVDVSDNQGFIDWPVFVADPKKPNGVIIKFNEGYGSDYIQQQFPRNWAAVKQYGLIRGLYTFLRPDINDPDKAANFLLNSIPPLDVGDIVVGDYEFPTDDRLGNFDYAGWIYEWGTVMKNALKQPIGLYSYPWFVETRLNDPRLKDLFWLWLAALDGLPASCGVWPTITLWQHTWKQPYAGIPYPYVVDESLIWQDRQGVLDLGYPGQKPTPIPPVKYQVLVDMQARMAPKWGAIYHPVQMVYKDAVLNGTGQNINGWVEVIAGNRPVWLLGSNLKKVS